MNIDTSGKEHSPADKEKRWLAILQSGAHFTLGRHTDPSPGELTEISRQIDGLGVPAWLAVSEGRYHGNGVVRLMMVRRLSILDGDWAKAERLWHEKRSEAAD